MGLILNGSHKPASKSPQSVSITQVLRQASENNLMTFIRFFFSRESSKQFREKCFEEEKKKVSFSILGS